MGTMGRMMASPPGGQQNAEPKTHPASAELHAQRRRRRSRGGGESKEEEERQEEEGQRQFQ